MSDNNNLKRAGSVLLQSLLGKLSLTGIAIIGGIVVVIVVVVAAILSSDTELGGGGPGGGRQLPDSVLVWEDDVLEALERHGLGDEHLPVLLAIMYQESKGNVASSNGDLFQASESKCGYIGCITDPIESIDQGVRHYKASLEMGESHEVDLYTVIQAYNFGTGYINFVSDNGSQHSEDLAKDFSMIQVEKSPSVYNCGGDTNNFRYPYCYGDYTYVSKVTAFLTTDGDSGDYADVETALDEDLFEVIMNEALKYEGYPYQWGGMHPSTSFDCSGIIQWAYAKAGINLPRTSYEQYNATKRISEEDLKAGDLIFFKTANYNPVTHVGIYVGNNQMYDANNSGIGYSDLNNYWSPKIVGYGRVG
jgi:cell wall-associated NlpC family hydrolase